MSLELCGMCARARARRHMIYISKIHQRQYSRPIYIIFEMESREHVLSLHPALPMLVNAVMDVSCTDGPTPTDVSDKCFRKEGENDGDIWGEADRVVLSTIAASEELNEECSKMDESVMQFCTTLMDAPPEEPQKKRKRFTRSQTDVLNKWFRRNQCPSPEDKMDLTALTGLTYKQVEGWFNNKRKRTTCMS